MQKEVLKRPKFKSKKYTKKKNIIQGVNRLTKQ